MICLVCFQYPIQSVLLNIKLLYDNTVVTGNESYD